MKKLFLIIGIAGIILFASVSFAADCGKDVCKPVQLARMGTYMLGANVPAAGEWFGNQDETPESWNTAAVSTVDWSNKYTCPGSGSRTATKMQVWAKGTGNIRLAIYAYGSTALVCDSTAEVALPGGTGAWVEATLTGCTLTGGTDYRLAASTDNAAGAVGYNAGGAGSTMYEVADYTAGFPDPWAEANLAAIIMVIRVWVQ